MNTSANRVLLVTGPAAGGLKRHVETLAARLPALGYEVAAAAPAGVFLPAVHCYPLDLGDRPRPTADLRGLSQLRRASAEWRPTLIHAHGVKAALLSLLAAPSGKPPVVVTYHNLWHGGLLTHLLRTLAPRAAASIAVSNAVRQSLANHRISPTNLSVVPNGVDPDSFPLVPGPGPGDPFVVLFMGRLTEEKGISVLLAAAALLVRYPEIRLRIAGDGPLRSAVEQSAGGSGAIEYLGQVRNVLGVYGKANAVVMPSLSEGLPMTALEAMACGLPLIASRVGGLPEVLIEGETGLLVPPADPAALAGAILSLCSDRIGAARMGAAGRRRIEAEFTEALMLQGLIRVYQRVVAGS